MIYFKLLQINYRYVDLKILLTYFAINSKRRCKLNRHVQIQNKCPAFFLNMSLVTLRNLVIMLNYIQRERGQ